MISKKPGKVKKLGGAKRRKQQARKSQAIPGMKELIQQNEDQRKDRPYLYERLHYKSPDIDMTLLIDHTNKTMRVIDYRMQQYKRKCQIFDTIARLRGLRKVYTLVEKQDTSSWRTVGFSKEAVVPLYFRTADAYVMSRLYEDGEPVTGGIAKLAHEKRPEFDEDPPSISEPRGIKVTFIDEPEDLQDLIDEAWQDAHYTTFIKDASQPHIGVRASSGRKKLWVTAEINDAFGHAKIDILTLPSTEREHHFTSWMIMELMRELRETYGVVSVFALARVDDTTRSEILHSAGFRVMGQLVRHVLDGKEHPHDVIVWGRKLQDLAPQEEEELPDLADDISAEDSDITE